MNLQKRLFVFFLIIALLVPFQSEMRAQFSGKVLFVTIIATARDSMVRDHFVQWGLTYDLMDIATFKAAVPADTTLAKYKFVYISEACKSADLGNARGLNAPIFTHKSYIAPKAVAGWCAGAAQNVTNTGDIIIMDGTHPLAGGYNTGDTVKLVTATSATKYINYFPKDPLVPMIGIAKVKGHAGDTSLVVVGIEKGTNIYASSSAATPTVPLKARVAVLGINSEANAYMTEASWTLAKAGVAWVMAGQVDVKDNAIGERSFNLDQNYPNPFNPSTTIRFSLQQSGNVQLRITDVLGNEVGALVNGYQTAGSHSATFDARNLQSGVYFYTLNFNGASITKKLLLMK